MKKGLFAILALFMFSFGFVFAQKAETEVKVYADPFTVKILQAQDYVDVLFFDKEAQRVVPVFNPAQIKEIVEEDSKSYLVLTDLSSGTNMVYDPEKADSYQIILRNKKDTSPFHPVPASWDFLFGGN